MHLLKPQCHQSVLDSNAPGETGEKITSLRYPNGHTVETQPSSSLSLSRFTAGTNTAEATDKTAGPGHLISRGCDYLSAMVTLQHINVTNS